MLCYLNCQTRVAIHSGAVLSARVSKEWCRSLYFYLFIYLFYLLYLFIYFFQSRMETEAGKFSSSLSSVEAILLVFVVSRLS